MTVTGTATDDDGDPTTGDGVVAVVEVSLDGGQTWRPASGNETWSYSWTPESEGTVEILARAIDDSLNLPALGAIASQAIEITAPELPSAFSLFDPLEPVDGTFSNDNAAVELGLRFAATESGNITELKYWRAEGDADDTDVRAGRLWDQNGNLLATVTFNSGPRESGWQVATLAEPVQIESGSDYVVSYRTNDNYLAAESFFDADFVDPFGKLTAPAFQNGVYAYGSDIVFPTQSYQASNYWADVSFEPAPVEPTSPDGTLGPTGFFTSSPRFVVAPEQTYVGRVAAVDPEGDALKFEIVGGAGRGRLAIDAETGELRFKGGPPGRLPPSEVTPEKLFDIIVRASDGEDAPFDQRVIISVGGGDRPGPPGFVDDLDRGRPDFVEIPTVQEARSGPAGPPDLDLPGRGPLDFVDSFFTDSDSLLFI